jgi:transcriptional regulator with XRE-family HTH domain
MSQVPPVDLDSMAPAKRLALVRLQVLHLSQRGLADLIEEKTGRRTGQYTIANVESGRRKPGLSLALALEEVAGIPAKAWIPESPVNSSAPSTGAASQEVA